FGATLANVRATGANFSSAEITASNLSNGDFSGASFRDASLDSARLSGGRFSRADFTDASLRRTDIRGADLSDARGLTQSQINQACGDGSTRLPGRLTTQTCRGGPRIVRAPAAPPAPPAPPVPPRRNLVLASD
ncbi:MAG: pentapeptide repeat-containing protein, partial [Brevundimonas sp.]